MNALADVSKDGELEKAISEACQKHYVAALIYSAGFSMAAPIDALLHIRKRGDCTVDLARIRVVLFGGVNLSFERALKTALRRSASADLYAA